MTENEIAKVIVDKCYKIHTTLGPGLFESVYENVLSYELSQTGIPFVMQPEIEVIYEGKHMGVGFRADIIVDWKVIVEIKSVATILTVHQKQVQNYLKITGLKLGLLVNFNEALIKDGIQRIVNKL